ncbi:MAG: ABC transporter ATP-binding protein/permease [Oscillospiraceae bacterium]|jgi:ATP-binding cassette subfamily B protein|nr:ABC transporter ATP-binding protein/permease [Oscillospiraceae bacterium]
MEKFKRAVSNMLWVMKPYWKYGKLYVIISFVMNVISAPIGAIAGVTVAQAVIDAVVAGNPLAYVLKIIAAYFGIFASTSLFQGVVSSYYRNWKRQEVNAKITCDLYEQAQKTDFKYIDDPKYFNGFEISLANLANISENMFSNIYSVLSSAVQVAVMIGIVSQIGAVIAIIIAAGAVASTIFAVRVSTVMIGGYEREMVPVQRRMDYATRVWTQNSFAPDLKSMRISELLIEGFREAAKIFVRTQKRIVAKVSFLSIGNNWTQKITEYAIIAYIAWGLATGRVESVGAYATLIAAASELRTGVGGFLYIIPYIKRDVQTAELVRKFFDLKSTIEPSSGDTPPDGNFTVEIKDAQFTYPNSAFALRGISIDAGAGEKIAIVGRNGAGKSTLMKLLLRLYDTGGGDILYNGKSIKDYDVHALRRRVGIAFQQPNVYALTLRDNLQAYNKAPDEALRRALVEAGLARLADSLDSEVTKEFDENGIMLSGGEAQKLAIARLLTGGSGLLLLDEPSSALDPIAEREVVDMLFSAANRATTIMVAHRLSTVRNADKIYVIEDGAVAETGTHDELMKLGGKYAEMFEKQAENYVK